MRYVKAVFGTETAPVTPAAGPNPAFRPYKGLFYLHTPIRHVILKKIAVRRSHGTRQAENKTLYTQHLFTL